MLLTDLLPQSPEVRPTRPTSKNNVGRQQSLVSVAPSDTSDTSDTKKALETSPEENGPEQSTFAQALYKNPESVRHLPLADDSADAPTPEQIAHARRMLVVCPSTGGKRHCGHCSRCGDARTCSAWHGRRYDVEFFRRSHEPFSLFLVESGAVEVVQ